jgi:hypothetical protein
MSQCPICFSVHGCRHAFVSSLATGDVQVQEWPTSIGLDMASSSGRIRRRYIEYVDGPVMTHEEATLSHAMNRWWSVGR